MKRLILKSACIAALALVSLAPGRARAQEFSIGAYGSVDYEAARTHFKLDNTNVNENGFSIPTLDIFMRGNAGNWSFLSEVLFDIDEGNEIVVDLDRLQLSYEFGDMLKVTAGRFHTSLGYYNTAYPQGGAVYLLAIDRPAVVDQHDHAAIVPPSTVGLNFHGRLPFMQQRFSYDLDVTNGRGVASDDLANGGDKNNSKMLNLRLRYEYEGFIIGGNALVDWIPPRLSVPANPATDQPNKLREEIYGAHLAYVEHPWHFIAEGYLVRHVGPDLTQRTVAGVAEFGYTIGKATPYVRYEFARFMDGMDAFYLATTQQERGNYDAVSWGVKIMPNENFALKIELEVNNGNTDTEYRAATQVAFGF